MKAGVAVLSAILLAPATAAPAAGGAEAVTTPGSATLTMCRDWLVYNSCSKYHNVKVPPVIAVGDKVRLRFGSNPKNYDFPVVAIRHHGDGCTIASNHTRPDDTGEKIEVSPCGATPAR